VMPTATLPRRPTKPCRLPPSMGRSRSL
jgi:hypothetical protein